MEYAFSKQLFSELLKRLLVDQGDHNSALCKRGKGETIFVHVICRIRRSSRRTSRVIMCRTSVVSAKDVNKCQGAVKSGRTRNFKNESTSKPPITRQATSISNLCKKIPGFRWFSGRSSVWVFQARNLKTYVIWSSLLSTINYSAALLVSVGFQGFHSWHSIEVSWT